MNNRELADKFSELSAADCRCRAALATSKVFASPDHFAVADPHCAPLEFAQ
jgi:hypothetical protein